LVLLSVVIDELRKWLQGFIIALGSQQGVTEAIGFVLVGSSNVVTHGTPQGMTSWISYCSGCA